MTWRELARDIITDIDKLDEEAQVRIVNKDPGSLILISAKYVPIERLRPIYGGQGICVNQYEIDKAQVKEE